MNIGRLELFMADLQVRDATAVRMICLFPSRKRLAMFRVKRRPPSCTRRIERQPTTTNRRLTLGCFSCEIRMSVFVFSLTGSFQVIEQWNRFCVHSIVCPTVGQAPLVRGPKLSHSYHGTSR